MSEPSSPQHPHFAISPNPINFVKSLGRHLTSSVTYFIEKFIGQSNGHRSENLIFGAVKNQVYHAHHMPPMSPSSILTGTFPKSSHNPMLLMNKLEVHGEEEISPGLNHGVTELEFEPSSVLLPPPPPGSLSCKDYFLLSRKDGAGPSEASFLGPYTVVPVGPTKLTAASMLALCKRGMCVYLMGAEL